MHISAFRAISAFECFELRFWTNTSPRFHLGLNYRNLTKQRDEGSQTLAVFGGCTAIYDTEESQVSTQE